MPEPVDETFYIPGSETWQVLLPPEELYEHLLRHGSKAKGQADPGNTTVWSSGDRSLQNPDDLPGCVADSPLIAQPHNGRVRTVTFRLFACAHALLHSSVLYLGLPSTRTQ